MSECERMELHERLPDYLHGSLSAPQRAEVEAHLSSCAAARAELALVRSARDAIVHRTPQVDTAAVVAAMHAARGARSALVITRRGAWRIAAAIALVATGAIGYWIGAHRTPVTKEQTVANGPATSAPVAPPEIPQAAPAPAPAPKLAPVPEAEPLPKSVAKLKELSVPGGVSDLPESETGALLNDLEKSGASFETEPMPDFDLGSGT